MVCDGSFVVRAWAIILIILLIIFAFVVILAIVIYRKRKINSETLEPIIYS